MSHATSSKSFLVPTRSKISSFASPQWKRVWGKLFGKPLWHSCPVSLFFCRTVLSRATSCLWDDYTNRREEKSPQELIWSSHSTTLHASCVSGKRQPQASQPCSTASSRCIPKMFGTNAFKKAMARHEQKFKITSSCKWNAVTESRKQKIAGLRTAFHLAIQHLASEAWLPVASHGESEAALHCQAIVRAPVCANKFAGQCGQPVALEKDQPGPLPQQPNSSGNSVTSGLGVTQNTGPRHAPIAPPKPSQPLKPRQQLLQPVLSPLNSLNVDRKNYAAMVPHPWGSNRQRQSCSCRCGGTHRACGEDESSLWLLNTPTSHMRRPQRSSRLDKSFEAVPPRPWLQMTLTCRQRYLHTEQWTWVKDQKQLLLQSKNYPKGSKKSMGSKN